MRKLETIHKRMAKKMIRDAAILGISIAAMEDLFRRVPMAARMAREDIHGLKRVLESLRDDYRSQKKGEQNVEDQNREGQENGTLDVSTES